MIHLPLVHFDTLVLHYIVYWKPLAYGILFLGMVFEGDIMLFTAGFLVSEAFLDPLPTFIVLYVGVLIGDSLWYWLGHRIGCSRWCVNRWITKISGPIDNHLLERPLHTIFISKFMYNFHHLVLIKAGILKLKFKKFFKNDIISSLGWIAIVGGLGYLSGASFALIKNYLKYAEIVLLLALAVFFLLNYLIVKYELKKKL